MHNKEWQEALRCFEEVQRLEPGYRESEKLLIQARQRLSANRPAPSRRNDLADASLQDSKAESQRDTSIESAQADHPDALPWWAVLVEGIVVALLGLVLLVAPGASLFFLVWLLGIYLFIAGIFRIIGIFLDSSSWGWKLAAGILCLIAGLAILTNPLWSTTLASTWLVILVGFLAMLQGAASLIIAFQGGGWGMGALSVLGILFGLFLVINPLIGVGALTLILAIFMLIGGVGAVIQAFRMRREAASAQQPGRVR